VGWRDESDFSGCAAGSSLRLDGHKGSRQGVAGRKKFRAKPTCRHCGEMLANHGLASPGADSSAKSRAACGRPGTCSRLRPEPSSRGRTAPPHRRIGWRARGETLPARFEFTRRRAGAEGTAPMRELLLRAMGGRRSGSFTLLRGDTPQRAEPIRVSLAIPRREGHPARTRHLRLYAQRRMATIWTTLGRGGVLGYSQEFGRQPRKTCGATGEFASGEGHKLGAADR